MAPGEWGKVAEGTGSRVAGSWDRFTLFLGKADCFSGPKPRVAHWSVTKPHRWIYTMCLSRGRLGSRAFDVGWPPPPEALRLV